MVAGPLHLVEGTVGLIARTPVFVGYPKSMATWWGNGVAIITLDRFMNASGIERLVMEGFHYHLEFFNFNTQQVELIANSSVMCDGVTMYVMLPNGFNWTLQVCPMGDHFPDGLAPWQDGLLVALCAGGVVVAAAGWALMEACLRRGRRDTSSAPTEPPVFLIFTDIESSTSLWVSHPAAMAAALVTHNRIIRHRIREADAYEVKTVGDSFMIACKTAKMALELCIAVQQDLRNETGWPQDIHDFYGPGHHWLQVRMGIHCCTIVDCKFDEVSKGYDYFGVDVNLCARIEAAAAGGEVLMSGPMAVAAASLGGYSIECLGEHSLKGIQHSEVLHRLNFRGVAASSDLPNISLGPHASRSLVSAPLSTQVDEKIIDSVVREYLAVSGEEDDGTLKQWVLLMSEALLLQLNPLASSARREVLLNVCAAWGMNSLVSHAIARLGLRIARIMRPKFPAVFRAPVARYLSESPRIPEHYTQEASAHSTTDSGFEMQAKVTIPSPTSLISCPSQPALFQRNMSGSHSTPPSPSASSRLNPLNIPNSLFLSGRVHCVT